MTQEARPPFPPTRSTSFIKSLFLFLLIIPPLQKKRYYSGRAIRNGVKVVVLINTITTPILIVVPWFFS